MGSGQLRKSVTNWALGSGLITTLKAMYCSVGNNLSPQSTD